MSYIKPDVFVNVTIAEGSITPITPSLYPTMVAPQFFVAYKEQVTDAGKNYFDGLPLSDIAYPLLPKQSITTASYLSVDVGDLTPAANVSGGSPNIERFDPDVFIITDDGVEVDISLATGLHVKTTGFDIPGNMTYDTTTGAWLTTKGDVEDGDMAAAAATDWTVVSTTNDPALAKDAGEKDYANDYALKITLHGTPDVGDGVKSDDFTVISGETYKAIFRAKKDSTDGVNFDLEVWDEDNTAQVTCDTTHTNKSNTDFETFELTFTVPANCSTISVQMHTAAATSSKIFYLGSVHLVYTGSDALNGEILVSYRALEEEYSGARLRRLEASTLGELQTLFGTHGVGPANPLGYMMYNAIRHGNMAVRGVAVGNPANDDGSSSYTGSLTSEILSYTASMDFIALDPASYYAIAMSTYNEAVWDVFLAYTNALAASSKYWSRLVVGAEIDTQITFRTGTDGLFGGKFTSASVGGFTDGDTITYSGNDYTIKVVDGVGYVALPIATDGSGISFIYSGSPETDGVFVIDDAAGVKLSLTSPTASNFVTAGYKKVKVDDSVLIGTAIYTVLTVRSDIIIMEHTSGAENGGGSGKSYSIYRYITLDGTSTGTPDKTTMAEMTRDRGKSYADDRIIINIPGWLSDTVNNVSTDVEIWYLNAQLAAEMCLPVNISQNQGPGFPVGLSFTGLIEAQTHTFHSVRYFNDTQLNTIASGGIGIVENLNPGLGLSLRHALSTDMTSIETQEIMMGVARDYCAYSFKSTMQNLVKRMRIAQPLGSALKMRLEGLKTVLVDREKAMQSITITNISSGATVDAVSVSGEWVQFYPLNRLDMDMKVVQPQPFTVSL